MPRYDLWSAGVQQPFPAHLTAAAEWISNSVLDVTIDQPLRVDDNSGRLPSALASTGPPATWPTGAPASRSPSPMKPATWSWRFHFYGYRFALRVGCNNVTDHRNPTAVNTTIGSYVLRIRVFGKTSYN